MHEHQQESQKESVFDHLHTHSVQWTYHCLMSKHRPLRMATDWSGPSQQSNDIQQRPRTCSHIGQCCRYTCPYGLAVQAGIDQYCSRSHSNSVSIAYIQPIDWTLGIIVTLFTSIRKGPFSSNKTWIVKTPFHRSLQIEDISHPLFARQPWLGVVYLMNRRPPAHRRCISGPDCHVAVSHESTVSPPE